MSTDFGKYFDDEKARQKAQILKDRNAQRDLKKDTETAARKQFEPLWDKLRPVFERAKAALKEKGADLMWRITMQPKPSIAFQIVGPELVQRSQIQKLTMISDIGVEGTGPNGKPKRWIVADLTERDAEEFLERAINSFHRHEGAKLLIP